MFRRKKNSDPNQNDKINDKINLLDKKILHLLADNAYMTIPEIAKATSKSEPTVHRHLNSLIAENKTPSLTNEAIPLNPIAKPTT